MGDDDNGGELERGGAAIVLAKENWRPWSEETQSTMGVRCEEISLIAIIILLTLINKQKSINLYLLI